MKYRQLRKTQAVLWKEEEALIAHQILQGLKPGFLEDPRAIFI